MKKRALPGVHPDEYTLVLLHNNSLLNPEEIEDHVLLCDQCLDQIEQISAVIEALRLGSPAAESPKSMTAGG
jgi:hypothetical protein